MPLPRTNRMDRRTYMLRQAAAEEPEYAAPRSRTRSKELDSQEPIAGSIAKGTVYSQAVRRACQHRLVQLIPVRRVSLWLLVGGCWSLWLALIGAHYMAYRLAAQSALRANVSWDGRLQWPISHLIDLRSPHGLAYWLGSQVWMLTALTGVLIYQLRKHRLNDYTANYRIWWAFIAAALFASFDASSESLKLVGMSIDPWARAEVGYSGWSLVLTSFSVIMGGLALRLCNELKSVPLSVLFWIGGLLSWGLAAVLGSGLVVLPWSKLPTDLLIGGCWLGGILAIWLSVGIFLRAIYIQAQSRFVSRSGLIAPLQWKVPHLKVPTIRLPKPWKRTESDDLTEDNPADSQRPNRKAFWSRRPKSGREDQTEDARRNWNWFGRQTRDPSKDAQEDPLAKRQTKSSAKSDATSSDAADEPETTREKRKWWGRQTRSEEADSLDPSDSERTASEGSRRSWWKRPAAQEDRGVEESKSQSKAKAEDRPSRPSMAGRLAGWMKRKDDKEAGAERPSTQDKKATLGSKPKTESKPPPASNASSSSTKKRGLFGFMEGLTLKPPVDRAADEKPSMVPPSKSSMPSTVPIQDVEEDDDDDDDNRYLSRAERKKLRREQRRAA